MKVVIFITEIKQKTNNKFTNHNSSLDFEAALSKQTNLVYQANDLAKAFGNLTMIENRVLDYLTSFININSKPGDIYKTNAMQLLKSYGLKINGYYYDKVAKACKKLMTHCLSIRDSDNKTTSTVPFINLYKSTDNSSTFKFRFSEEVVPYLIDLKQNYYSIRFSELSRIKSKYTLIFVKLWEANRIGNDNNFTIISGSLDDWEKWFIGDKHWPAGRFKQKVLNTALNEISEKFDADNITIDNKKRGSKIVGYDISIVGTATYHSKRRPSLFTK